jgi:hypothetical protein
LTSEIGSFWTINVVHNSRYGDYYADKTKILYELVKKPDPFSLSRPRRFGKTLLVSTLESILLGRKELFEGLWIHGSDHDWTPYPVIRLEMNKAFGETREGIEYKLCIRMERLAKRHGVDIDKTYPSDMLEQICLNNFIPDCLIKQTAGRWPSS